MVTIAGVIGAPGLKAQAEAGAQQAAENAGQAPDQKKAETAPPTSATTTAPKGADTAKLKWTGSVTAGFQLSRGQTNANGVSVAGDAQYAGVERGYRFEGTWLYATVRVPTTPGETAELTAQDKRNGYFTFYQEIKGPLFLVDRVSAEHDVLRDTKFRTMDLAGIGLRLAATQKFQAFVAPGVGYVYADRPNLQVGNFLAAGAFERASWHISRIWTFDQWFQYRVNPNNSHDYSLDGFAGLTGLVYTTKLGFSLGYIYSYEGLIGVYGGTVVPTTPYHTLSQLTIGLKFTL
jgi:hypothetical protein